MVPDDHARNNFQAIWRRKLENADNSIYVPGQNERVDTALKMLDGGHSILDIGCGSGILMDQLRGRYTEVHGVDISGNAVAAAQQRRLDAQVIDLNHAPLPFMVGFFDSVTILSTLQYFYDPDSVLRECSRVLSAGSLLLLSIPNMRAIWRVGRLFFMGTFPKVSKDMEGYDGGTLHYFAYSDLKALLERNGFEVVSTRGIFCRPRVISRFTDSGIVGEIKREFFGAEVFVKARKVT